MKNLSIVALFVGLFTSSLLGQTLNFQWARTVVNTGFLTFKSDRTTVVCDSADGFLAAGMFQGTGDFDPQAGTVLVTSTSQGLGTWNENDVFVAHYSNDAQLDWVKNFGKGIIYFDVKRDPSGHILIAGNFTDTTDFDPGPASFFMNAPPNTSPFLLKLDPNGDFEWATSFQGGGTNPPSMAVDAYGNTILTGSMTGTVDFLYGPGTQTLTAPAGKRLAYIAKIDPNGNLLWVKGIELNGDVISEFVPQSFASCGPNGKIQILGSFYGGAVDFDPGPGTFSVNHPGSESWAYLLQLDSAGDFQWVRVLDGDNVYPTFIETDGFGKHTIGGTFRDDMDVDPSPISNSATSLGQEDAFLVKLDGNGDFRWARTFNSDLWIYFRDLTIDQVGNVFFSLLYSHETFTKMVPGNFDTIGEMPQGGVALGKIDTTGNIEWYHQLLRTHYTSLSVDRVGNLLAASDNLPTIDLDPGPGFQSYTAAASNDYQPCFVLYANLPAGISPSQIGRPSARIFPNPATDHLFVEVASRDLIGSTYRIFDLQGRELSAGKLDQSRMRIDLADLTWGVYFLQIEGESRQVIKFVKE